MEVKVFSEYNQLETGELFPPFREFSAGHPNSNFFQSHTCFKFLEKVEEYNPFLLLAHEQGQIEGSLLGVIQSNGQGLKSWFSRRLIVWGGPLLNPSSGSGDLKITDALLKKLKKYASGKAIFVEFRNFFDTEELKPAFETCGFTFRPHLNYLVKTDTAEQVNKRMSKSRRRQIKSCIKAGAEVVEGQTEEDVMAFYKILAKLYEEKVKKPLSSPDLFLKFLHEGIGKYFLIKYDGRIVGGIMCPIYQDKVIYEWYVCGEDGLVKGLHPSVLATWAPIEYAVNNQYEHFDFMGAGKPDEDYGVREFKARFGGEEVNFGRYGLILNSTLYKVGQLGLKYYQKLK